MHAEGAERAREVGGDELLAARAGRAREEVVDRARADRRLVGRVRVLSCILISARVRAKRGETRTAERGVVLDHVVRQDVAEVDVIPPVGEPEGRVDDGLGRGGREVVRVYDGVLELLIRDVPSVPWKNAWRLRINNEESALFSTIYRDWPWRSALPK